MTFDLYNLPHDLLIVALATSLAVLTFCLVKWRTSRAREHLLAASSDHLEAELEDLRGRLNATSETLQSQLVETESQRVKFDGVVDLNGKLEHERVELNEKIMALRLEIDSLKHERAQVQTQLQEREKAHQQAVDQFDAQRKSLKVEFENLSQKIFEERGRVFNEQSKSSLEGILKPLREQLGEFRSRVDTVQKEHSESQVSLLKELEQLKNLNASMSEDAQNLTQVLKGDKKKLGNWGEIQVEKTLQYAGLVRGDHYQTQAGYKDDEGRTKLPDFVIYLPDEKHLIVDSKVSLVDYERAMSAEDEEQQSLFLKGHIQAVRNHIDDLSRKDYAQLHGINSPSFVLLFMPIEASYIEVLKQEHDLFNYAYAKGVVLVSHTTLMPILRTVSNLWMIEKSTQEAKALGDTAAEVYKQVCVMAERIAKLGNSLNAATNHYNDSVTALSGNRGLYAKVERFSSMSSKVTRALPELKMLEGQSEVKRLDVTKDDSV